MKDEGTRIHACKIPKNTLLRDLGPALEFIPPSSRDRLLRYKFEVDSVRSALGELLVRKYLAKQLNTNPGKLEIFKNKYGKPYLEGPGGIHFNISHSGDWVAAGFSQQKIGVDIEIINRVDWDMADSCFSEVERKYILHPDNGMAERRFFEIWTLRESFMKAEGYGFSFGMENFSLEKTGDSNFKVVPEALGCNYSLWTDQLDSQHIISTAVSGMKGKLPAIEILHLSEVQAP